MKQTRNLILNILLNLMAITGIGLLSLYYGTDKFDYSVSFYILNFLYIALISAFGMMVTSQSATYYRRKYPIPACFFVLGFYLIQYLIGDAKIIRSTTGKYYSRFANDEIIVYYMSPFYIEKIGEYNYTGTPDNLATLKDHLDAYYTGRHMTTPRATYREWDGALDDASRRINTIDNIIK